ALVAQDDRGLQPGERAVAPAALPLDKPGDWTLHFRYTPPRIATVKGFDEKGNPVDQQVWYMRYQVSNRSTEPVTILPEFELVTKDLNTAHLDEPQPFIFDQVKRIEDRTIGPGDPAGVLNLLSSIEISKRPIPPSKPDGFPKLVSGLAIWTDMTKKAPGTNKFSVYVTGLSNGVATEQVKAAGGGKGVELIKKKTLKLDFIRPTDDRRPETADIRPDDANGASETWVYRAAGELKRKTATVPLPGGDKDKKPQE
ncbi:MAG: hypothetical protein K2X82_18045, partial [Gemmataceae bacterium]|nr:hypothetical protein [Gemmataceae bacterium]